MKIGDVAGDVGRGLLAGAIGTAAISLSQAIEMKLRHRPPSATPAQAAGKVLGVKPVGKAEEQRFAALVHWGYGTAWGGARGLLGAAGLQGFAADAALFGAVSSAAALELPALKVGPPVTQQPPEEVAVQSLHHLVYAAAVGLAFAWLTRETTNRSD